MAAAEDGAYYGTWRIVECVSLTGTVETTGIEGTEFQLDESGDVSWKVSEDAEPMPFFNCETYEVTPGAASDPAVLKFIWTYEGHVIEFRVEVADDLMLLTYERCCMLQCQKVSSNDPKDDVPFSFLSAMEEGYFSELNIRADSGREFKVHQVLLQLSAPEMDWLRSPPPLTGLREDVLQATLHYLYSECLPRGLSEDTAKACIKSVGKLPGFSRFSDLCDTFLKNTALKQQITNLISDMHGCADKIIELFSVKGGVGEGHLSVDSSLMSNPAKLCYTVRQGLKEAAVACAKLLILCDLFSKRKGELSREERHEIMKYAKSRLPVFMNQLHKFLEVIKQHTSSLTAPQRNDIATYLVPELETTLDLIFRFAVETKDALDKVITSSNTSEKSEKSDKHKKGHVGDVLGKALKNALHMKELKKLKNFHDRTSASFTHLMQKKENFGMMTHGEKVRSVSKNLEQVIDEVPFFLVRLEELMAALDEKVTWREWKYLFKLGTSKVAWGLGKVLANKSTLQHLIDQACDITNRDQFTASLASLGLTSPDASQDSSGAGGGRQSHGPTKYAQLSSIESLCIPPYARDSRTAKRALELLRKGEKTDMTFEIEVVHEGGDIVIDHTHPGEPVERTDEGEVEVKEVRAHCVIIAARCDWFRRALLSGMKESIHKKITVHDTNPELFQLFLEYLYSGQLETNELSTEQLADMTTLCDRYEMDSLKSVCEHALKHHIDDETALYLLSLADQLHCKFLRETSLHYITEHHSLADSEVFEDLPEHLQAEVEDAIAWHGLEPRTARLRAGPLVDTPSSLSSVSEVDELMTNIDLMDRPHDLSTSSSSEDLPFMEDPSRLESCLDALRDIVGDTVPQDELVRIAMAADYDTNRALNFFFSS
ncbi:uncharacterized protein LOC124153093 [Haliotis rufescens]|uniref:uncharacterized protein LOC124153093 n=1 Tax=Haliotis rufescens TaxID=6454 RepID=UPI001EAFCBC8|nr:uncharacterized protein LOC124153093 [Haliotis rufescens]